MKFDRVNTNKTSYDRWLKLVDNSAILIAVSLKYLKYKKNIESFVLLSTHCRADVELRVQLSLKCTKFIFNHIDNKI